MKVEKRILEIEKKAFRNLHIFFMFSGIIMIWRGLWNLFDLLLFPGLPVYSNILSILIGICIVLIYRKNLKSLLP